ncbi:GNAT family N-acetyltransferase [Pigmentibacter ruber]|uniref:GNAT family N-acetyltransferase n=1 Tax=Pigmentibacter ruber TaxID=2683196 RepID=UPI00131E7524|nr:GNAT family N-acetyltransferase [Pigmentibacter ruber]
MPEYKYVYHYRYEEKKKMLHYFAALRIIYFRDFPYLYAGSFEYELCYLQNYLDDPNSVFITIQKENQILGFAAGGSFANLASSFGNVADKFRMQGFEPQKLFYIGEVIVRSSSAGEIYGAKLFKKLVHFSLDYHFEGVVFCQENCSNENKNVDQTLKNKDEKFKRVFLKSGFSDPNINIEVSYDSVENDNSIKEKTHTLKFWYLNYKEIIFKKFGFRKEFI